MHRRFRYAIILTTLFLLVIEGCEKWLKDDDLTLDKEQYTGNELKIDGYYYLASTINNSFNDTYFFYRDGTVLSFGGTPIGESPFEYMENLLNSHNTNYQNYKYGWGVFSIKGDSIAIERWYPQESELPAYLLVGDIINDTTFRITSLTRKKTGEKYEKDDIFRFHAFSPKPDSTNVFIQ